MDLNAVWIAACLLGLLALVFGVILAVGYRFLRVEEDPRIDQVEEMLPGSNCGACGEPGCRALAERIVNGEKPPANCTVASSDMIESIAAYLGVEAGSVDKLVARLHCAGGKGFVKHQATYLGTATCGAAALVGAGERSCPWGCLGLGDCERACTFDAIRMNERNLPVVNPDRCTACGDCVEVCPFDLFTLEPLSQKLIVQCRSPLTGDQAREACLVACDACGRCALDALPGTIEMQGGLPRILKPEQTTKNATFRCPTGAIQWVEQEQFAPMNEERKTRRSYG